MTYAKVKDTALIIYPYTFRHLQEENPHTNFGNNWDVAYWYPTTTDAITNGYTLVEVTIESQPIYDVTSQICIQNSSPVLSNGTWSLGYTIIDMTLDQQREYQTQIQLSNKSQAKMLLANTDWCEIPSVTNTSSSPHLLNQLEFINYRTAVRAIFVNPPTTPAIFPSKPSAQWSS
jgi:hypothetical protein